MTLPRGRMLMCSMFGTPGVSASATARPASTVARHRFATLSGSGTPGSPSRIFSIASSMIFMSICFWLLRTCGGAAARRGPQTHPLPLPHPVATRSRRKDSAHIPQELTTLSPHPATAMPRRSECKSSWGQRLAPSPDHGAGAMPASRSASHRNQRERLPKPPRYPHLSVCTLPPLNASGESGPSFALENGQTPRQRTVRMAASLSKFANSAPE
jgi:hypothetical protein